MHGYILCSEVSEIKGKPRIVDELHELEELYNQEKVELTEPVYLGGKLTTFGRAKIEHELGVSINKALGYSDDDKTLHPITNKNIDDLMRYIALHKNAAEITKNIRMFVLEMSTLEGFTSLSLDRLSANLPKEFVDKLEAVREDATLDGIQKFVRIKAIESEMKKYVEDNMDPDLRTTMINSNRMKISALMEMTLPQSTVDSDGRLLSNESSLYESLNEEEYRAHSLQNRDILSLKQKLVNLTVERLYTEMYIE